MQIELATAAAVKVADAKITADLVEKAIKADRMRVVSMSSETNPQAVKMREAAQVRLDVLESVLQSLKGHHIDLKVYANG